MKRFALISILILAVCTVYVRAQSCPTGQVCIDQQTANSIYHKLDELIAARDLIAKLQAERGASDASLAAANKLLADYQQLMVVRDSIDAKKDALIALYQHTIELYASLVEKLEARINQPRSAFQKFLAALKDIAILAAGITIGRGL